MASSEVLLIDFDFVLERSGFGVGVLVDATTVFIGFSIGFFCGDVGLSESAVSTVVPTSPPPHETIIAATRIEIRKLYARIKGLIMTPQR